MDSDYLRRIDGQLKAGHVDAATRKEIVSELSSHIAERVAELKGTGSRNASQEVLDSLGDPAVLAAEFIQVAQLRSAGTSYLPTRLLAAGWTLARSFGYGLGLFLTGLVGYSLAAGGLAVALMKLAMPERVGLWVGDHGVVWGLPPDGALTRELAGEWFLPISLWMAVLFGCGATLLIRKQLRSLALPRSTGRVL